MCNVIYRRCESTRRRRCGAPRRRLWRRRCSGAPWSSSGPPERCSACRCTFGFLPHHSMYLCSAHCFANRLDRSPALQSRATVRRQEESEELRSLQSHITAAQVRMGQQLQLRERASASVAGRQEGIAMDRVMHQHCAQVHNSESADAQRLLLRTLSLQPAHLHLQWWWNSGLLCRFHCRRTAGGRRRMHGGGRWRWRRGRTWSNRWQAMRGCGSSQR